MQHLTLAISLLAALGTGAQAGQGLMGHGVSFQVLTYDDPATPIFQSSVHTSRVTEGIEFGLGREGAQNLLDVVPILVDISADRIEVSYSIADPGDLWKAAFNGYVLTFDAPCPTITRARFDPKGTNLPFDNKRILVDGNSLRLNVSDISYDRDSRIAIDLTVTDCPSG